MVLSIDKVILFPANAFLIFFGPPLKYRVYEMAIGGAST